jgi:thioredoxin-related protein
MLTRRLLLAGTMLVAARPPRLAAQALLTEDGLYRQPWFLDSLLELADDLDAAGEKGRRLVVIWELRGCPSCKDTHLINFARTDISDYVRARFDVLQLNLIGAREVVDFDGEKLSEKRLAEKYGIRFTPTFQFFPEASAGLASRRPRQREVARAQGYLPPEPFLAMFRFVVERAYEKGNLPDYIKSGS